MDDKIEYLDGLRGMASLMVVLHHYLCAFYPVLIFGASSIVHIGPIEAWIAASPLNLFYNGGFAVCIFFVLSGYVLTNKFFRTKQHEVIISSAVRRYVRLMIPILFTVISAYILLAGRFYYNIPVSNITGSQWLASANNYTPSFADVLKQGLWGVFFESPNQFISSFNNVLWTIKIEFIGSILVFSFVSLLGDLKNRWVFYVTTALILLKTYYLAFIIGMILSDLYTGKNSEKFTVKNSLVKVELLVVGLFFGSYYLGGWWGESLCESLHLSILNSSELFRTIGAGLVFIVLLKRTKLKKVFSNKIFVFLGKISFTMYLLHLLVIYSVSSLLFMALFTVLPYNISYIIMFLFTFPIVLDVSYLAHKYVDDPGVRLSRMIYDRYFRSVPVKQKEKEHNVIIASEPF